MKDIILFGIQGSGKSTVSKKLIEKYPAISYFEAGNILRSLKTTDNVIGNYLKTILDSGNLVKDSFMISIFDAYLSILDLNQFMLIDGFPRKISQAYQFLERLEKFKRDYCAVVLDLSENEAINRLSNRRMCQKCHKIYNLIKDGSFSLCPDCGGHIVMRDDDAPESVKKRINTYYTETLPVIRLFEDQGRLKRIDAERDIDDIIESIEKLFDK